MKVVLLTAHLSKRSGGFAASVPSLSRALNALDEIEARILGVRDPLAPGGWREWGEAVHFADASGPRRFGFAPALGRRLTELDPDLVDVQGIWMYHSVISLRRHRRTGKPYVVTPRGMLDSWALRNGNWKKWVVRRWFEDAHLANAACIRALNEEEAAAIRASGLRNPVAVVPNGVDMPAETGFGMPGWRAGMPVGRRVMLFLGRIHAKKGVLEMLEAWASLGRAREGWHLVVAGWDDGGLLPAMRKRIDRPDLSQTVTYIGPQYGSDKHATYAAADAFLLPSHGEGLPMTVLEAWSHGLPAVMTRHCNLPEGFAAGAAIEVEPVPASIAEGIRQLAGLSEAGLRDMGHRGRELVARKFAWPGIARQMREVYEWVLGGGPPPPCVMTD